MVDLACAGSVNTINNPRKMKRLVTTILLISICFVGFSQHISRTLSFRLESLSGQPIQQKYIYLEQNDSIVARAMTYFDGVAHLVFCCDSISDNYNLIVRQSQECVSKVSLSYFGNNDSQIALPKMKITLENDAFREIGENGVVSRPGKEYDGKFVFGNIPDGIQNYFPFETLLYAVTGYYQEIDSSYYEAFYNMVGHYPSKFEIDSIVNISRNQEANLMQRWFSYNLSMLQEPILHENQINKVFRFSWFVNNGYHRQYEPYSVRIELDNQGNKTACFSYRLWDECEHNPLFCVFSDLDDVIFNTFLNIIQKMEFWESPSLIEKDGSFDKGSTNIFEANIDGQYHVIFRGEGEDEGMEELREFLWGLTGLGENKIVHRRQRIE